MRHVAGRELVEVVSEGAGEQHLLVLLRVVLRAEEHVVAQGHVHDVGALRRVGDGAVDGDGASCLLELAENRVEQRGLAASDLADNAVEPPLVHLEVLVEQAGPAIFVFLDGFELDFLGPCLLFEERHEPAVHLVPVVGVPDCFVPWRPAEGGVADVDAHLVCGRRRAANHILVQVSLVEKGVQTVERHPALHYYHSQDARKLLQGPPQRVQQRQRREGGGRCEPVAIDHRVDAQRHSDDDDGDRHGDGVEQSAVDRRLADHPQLVVPDRLDLPCEALLPRHELDDADATHHLLDLLNAIVGVLQDGALEASQFPHESARDRDERDHDNQPGEGGPSAQDVNDQVQRDTEAQRDGPEVVDHAHAHAHAVRVVAHHVRDLPLGVGRLRARAELGHLPEQQPHDPLPHPEHALPRGDLVVSVRQEVDDGRERDGDGENPRILRGNDGWVVRVVLHHQQDLLHQQRPGELHADSDQQDAAGLGHLPDAEVQDGSEQPGPELWVIWIDGPRNLRSLLLHSLDLLVPQPMEARVKLRRGVVRVQLPDVLLLERHVLPVLDQRVVPAGPREESP